MRTYVRVTSSGSPHTIFRRAVAAGDAQTALLVSNELGRIGPADALALVLVLLDAMPERYPLAAARWHALAVRTAGSASLADASVLLAALHALADAGARSDACASIEAWAKRYGLRDIDRELDVWGARRRRR